MRHARTRPSELESQLQITIANPASYSHFSSSRQHFVSGADKSLITEIDDRHFVNYLRD